jgi:hypothetical protein
MYFDFPADEPVSQRRGAAPVGCLHELGALERAAILHMRAWCEGGAARAQTARDFRRVLSEAEATAAAADFDALMRVTLAGARRPLVRHGFDCPCFGGDESAFASLVAAAAVQDREDAMLFAGTLAAGPAAFVAVQIALTLGQTFLRIARNPTACAVPTHTLDRQRRH